MGFSIGGPPVGRNALAEVPSGRGYAVPDWTIQDHNRLA